MKKTKKTKAKKPISKKKAIENVDNLRKIVEPKKLKQPSRTKNQKFKTVEALEKMFEEWASHLAKGYSKESFTMCDPQTFKKYKEKYPNIYKKFENKINEAERVGRLFWEKTGMAGTLGKIKYFNCAAWIFNMKNRYGWKDRIDHTSGDEKISTDYSNISTDELLQRAKSIEKLEDYDNKK